jgi:hypothetical protein
VSLRQRRFFCEWFVRFYLLRRFLKNVETLGKAIAEKLGIDFQVLFQRGRQKPISQAKAMLIYAGVEKLGETQAHMAKMVKVKPGAVGRARQRGWAL